MKYRRVSINDILLAVQRVTRVGVRDLKFDGQSPHIREARVLVYFVASQCFDKSFSEIAEAMGRDRTTVAGTIKKRLHCTRFDPALIDQVEDAAEAIADARLAGRPDYSGYPIFAHQGEH